MRSVERSLPITVTSVSFRHSMDRATQGVDQILKDPLRVKVEGALIEIFNGQQPVEIGTQRALVGLYNIPERTQDTNTFANTIADSLPQNNWEEQYAAAAKAGEQVVALLETSVIQPDAYSRDINKQRATMVPDEFAMPMILAVELTSLGAQVMEKIIKDRGMVVPETQ